MPDGFVDLGQVVGKDGTQIFLIDTALSSPPARAVAGDIIICTRFDNEDPVMIGTTPSRIGDMLQINSLVPFNTMNVGNIGKPGTTIRPQAGGGVIGSGTKNGDIYINTSQFTINIHGLGGMGNTFVARPGDVVRILKVFPITEFQHEGNIQGPPWTPVVNPATKIMVLPDKTGVSGWGDTGHAVVGSKIVFGRITPGTTITIYDSKICKCYEVGGLTSAIWGHDAIVTVGNKVVLGRYSDGASIAVYDSVLDNVMEISVPQVARWGELKGMVVVGTKVVLSGATALTNNSILIYDAVTNTVVMRSGLSSQYWGQASMAVVGTKVVIGCANTHTAIAVYDSELDTLMELGGLPNGAWGFYAICVVGTKVVLCSDVAAGAIVIYDSVTNTVVAKSVPLGEVWGSKMSLAVVGQKVVFGRVETAGTSILVYDSVLDTVVELTGFSLSRRWGAYGTKTVGNKVVLSCGGSLGTVIGVYDSVSNTVSQIGSLSLSAMWGQNAILAVGLYAIIGQHTSHTTATVVAIYDSAANTLVEKSISYGGQWLQNSMACIGPKIVFGSGGTAVPFICVYDSSSNTLQELGPLALANWGGRFCITVGTQVFLQSNDGSVVICYGDIIPE